jgi:two-component sensor histidine kinase
MEVKASLKEKEELLKEVHHRVKNNLQVISSLLSLQSKYIKDEETADVFKQSQSRIQSIALIHEKLYQAGDFTKIEFSRYVADLTNNLLRTYGMGRIKVNVDIKDVLLNIEYAIPCGLIINEMVTNSLKHAFPGGRDGNINIYMRKREENVELIVADDGTGMRGIDPRNSKTLGMQLLTNIVEKQLEGKIGLDTKNGTKFKINFRVD